MNSAPAMPVRADYGIDAPEVVRRFAFIGRAGLLVGVVLLILSRKVIPPGLAISLAISSLCLGGTFFMISVVMLWGSRIGKLRLRDKLLNLLSWRGDEQVLDVGCGHGLMLIDAARRLTTGKAIGVDLWGKADQAGNSPQATLANARIEGVAEKIELKDGDARKLAFEDGTFDVVLSSWALHNIYDPGGRAKAVGEIVRVLKPGGRVVIVDIRNTGEYARTLQAQGMANVKRSGPNFLFAIPSYTLAARKPDRIRALSTTDP